MMKNIAILLILFIVAYSICEQKSISVSVDGQQYDVSPREPRIQMKEVVHQAPVIVQKLAPQFTATAVLPDGSFKKISLSDYRGKYVVLMFYPLDFTFVCPTEIIAFSDAVEKFKKLNTEVMAISVDSEFTHLAWMKTPRNEGGLGKINIPLVSDITKEISKKYGVLLENEGVALRGLFIIDTKGYVRQITVNDLPVGRNVDEVLRLISAFQFSDKHGEVCPANWTPGKDTIKPNPIDSKEFFAKQK